MTQAKRPFLTYAEGATRFVLLIGPWALKFPNLRRGWRLMLHGLLANMSEARFSEFYGERVCPVSWHVWGGWLVVMRRCEPVSDEVYEVEMPAWFFRLNEMVVPAEDKPDSFGMLNGRFVAIDYAE